MSQNSGEQIPCDGEKTAQNDPNEANLLLNKVEKYETIFKSNTETIKQLENDLKKRETELAGCKQQITQLEEQVAEAQKFKTQYMKESEEVASLKQKSEDTLTKAKSMIFDKTKVVKNQELQIEALNQQISSLKDVVAITKDLLEIRNLEVKQLETKLQCMEDKISAEKERHDLMHKKLEHMIRYNGELRREYETQLCLFNALREKYSERELAKGVLDDLKTQVPQASSSSSLSNGHVDEKPEEKKEE